MYLSLVNIIFPLNKLIYSILHRRRFPLKLWMKSWISFPPFSTRRCISTVDVYWRRPERKGTCPTTTKCQKLECSIEKENVHGTFCTANWLILANFDPNFVTPTISVNQVSTCWPMYGVGVLPLVPAQDIKNDIGVWLFWHFQCQNCKSLQEDPTLQSIGHPTLPWNSLLIEGAFAAQTHFVANFLSNENVPWMCFGVWPAADILVISRRYCEVPGWRNDSTNFTWCGCLFGHFKREVTSWVVHS